MDRIMIILKKENGPRASSAPALVLNTIIFKYVYSYMKQISGERLQDHWSYGQTSFLKPIDWLNPNFNRNLYGKGEKCNIRHQIENPDMILTHCNEHLQGLKNNDDL